MYVRMYVYIYVYTYVCVYTVQTCLEQQKPEEQEKDPGLQARGSYHTLRLREMGYLQQSHTSPRGPSPSSTIIGVILSQMLKFMSKPR